MQQLLPADLDRAFWLGSQDGGGSEVDELVSWNTRPHKKVHFISQNDGSDLFEVAQRACVVAKMIGPHGDYFVHGFNKTE